LVQIGNHGALESGHGHSWRCAPRKRTPRG
jgi:hypothetical protein